MKITSQSFILSSYSAAIFLMLCATSPYVIELVPSVNATLFKFLLNVSFNNSSKDTSFNSF